MVIGKQFLTDIQSIIIYHSFHSPFRKNSAVEFGNLYSKKLGRPCVMTCSKKLETIFAYKLVRFYIGLYMLQRGLAKNPIRIRYSPLWTVLEVQHGAHFKLGITLGRSTKNIYLNIGFHEHRCLKVC